MRENPYKGIEKYIDPSKLPAEFVPDIYDEDKGKILMVGDDLESFWADKKSVIDEDLLINIDLEIDSLRLSIKKLKQELDLKVSVGDFNGAVQILEQLITTVEILSNRIEMSIEEGKITGAYLPGSNKIPTRKWTNIVNPIDFADLEGFLFMQDSGWINRESSHSLMFGGREELVVNSKLDTNGDSLNLCFDMWINLYNGSVGKVIEAMDGFFLRDTDGLLSIKIGGFEVKTTHALKTGLSHVCFNICLSKDIADIYVDNVKLDTVITKKETFELPKVLRCFKGMVGEVYNFKFYRKALTSSEIKDNFEEGSNGSHFTYAYLVSLFEASKAETVYANFEMVRASITLLKDEIKLQASRLEGISNLTGGAFKKLRYIRVHQKGSNKTLSESRWLEVQLFDSKEDNILFGITPIASHENAHGLHYVTDNEKIEYASIFHNEDESVYLEFDLGYLSSDSMFLKLWNYYHDYRKCKGVMVSISEDKEKWITLFNSDISGEYEEDLNGLTVPINVGNYLENLSYRLQHAELKITPEAIVATVLEHARFKEYTEKEINDAIFLYKQIVDSQFNDVANATKDLEETMNGAFKDGIISEAEAKAINERLVAIEKEKADVQKEYETIYNDENLIGSIKEELSSSNSKYITAYVDLKVSIIKGIEDSLVNQDEIDLINTNTNLYKESHSSYREVFIRAVNSIGDKKLNSLDTKYETRCSTIEQRADRITMRVEAVENNKVDNSAMAEAISGAIAEYKIEVDKEFQEVTDATLALEDEMKGAFKDGIVSESEAISIEKRLSTLDKEKKDIDEEYLAIIINESLTGTIKATLEDSKKEFDQTHSTLVSIIRSSILDKLVTTEEVSLIGQATDNYNKASSTFRGNYSKAIDAISKAYSEIAQNNAVAAVNKAISDYKKVVDSQFADVNNATTSLEQTMNGAFKDGVISEAEAKALKERLLQIEKEKLDIDKEYANIIDSKYLTVEARDKLYNTKTSYDSSFSNLSNSILTGIEDRKITSEEIKLIDDYTESYKKTNSLYREAFTKTLDVIGDVKAKEIDDKYERRCSVIEQTVDSITLRVSHVEPIVDEHTKRITEAEIKIEPDAITSTVMQSTEFNNTIKDIVKNINYDVEIISTDGNIFKNGVIETTLIAVVRKGIEDITNKIAEGKFIWTRVSDDKESDKIWNQKYVSGRKRITITHEDVLHKATFNCIIKE